MLRAGLRDAGLRATRGSPGGEARVWERTGIASRDTAGFSQ
jgi:hypothetical protein